MIEDLSPVVSDGRYPAKAITGEQLPVRATIWREGHDATAASVMWRGPGEQGETEIRMSCVNEGQDRWQATVVPAREGMATFRVVAWADPWLSWCRAIEAKVADGQGADLSNDWENGARLLERLAGPARRSDELGLRDRLLQAAAVLRASGSPADHRLAAVRSAAVQRAHDAHPIREAVEYSPDIQVWVDRTRALYGSWYEMFPRSTGGLGASGRPVHGTLVTARAALARIADMGFDVVYLPPIHPIGEVNRKGPNNSVVSRPDDPGSPWAVGSADGGHDAIHPALGTPEDFDAFVTEASRLGLEVALDLAFQCAPDHPWVSAHPEWFTVQPDGSIACAQNPPKVYQDIYPLNFDNDPHGLYAELLRVTRFWIDRGVQIFRVDNPHTKPTDFWHRLIWEVKKTDPGVLFLSEAFTRPAVLRGLAKLGFTQSYTYFTWRNKKQELEEYMTELVRSAHFLLPNFFVNTPDILPFVLQHGGPSAFALRAALAATLAPSWGVYSGYELFEATALKPGSEEYLDSEKYELKYRDYARALAEERSLEPYLTRLNQIRRAHPALQRLQTLRFHEVDNDALIAYSKIDRSTGDIVLCVVTLDPSGPEEGTLRPDRAAMEIPAGADYILRDEISGEISDLGETTHVKLEPWRTVARIWAVSPA